jgi:hypothetical protein
VEVADGGGFGLVVLGFKAGVEAAHVGAPAVVVFGEVELGGFVHHLEGGQALLLRHHVAQRHAVIVGAHQQLELRRLAVGGKGQGRFVEMIGRAARLADHDLVSVLDAALGAPLSLAPAPSAPISRLRPSGEVR